MYQMLGHLKKLRDDEAGAVTVDWVVLTAAVVGLAAAGWTTTRDGVMVAANTTSSGVATQSVNNGN